MTVNFLRFNADSVDAWELEFDTAKDAKEAAEEIVDDGEADQAILDHHERYTRDDGWL